MIQPMFMERRRRGREAAHIGKRREVSTYTYTYSIDQRDRQREGEREKANPDFITCAT